MRCARSSACTRMPGVQCSSAKTTVLAAVRVMPTPAASRPRIATRTVSSDWNRLVRRKRSAELTEPSMRMNFTLFRTAVASSASNMTMWWPKMRNLQPPWSRSSAYSQTGPTFARPVSLYICMRTWCLAWGALPSVSSSCSRRDVHVAAASRSTSSCTRCRRFEGSSSRTSAFSRRTMMGRRWACSSSRLDAPVKSMPKGVHFGAQKREVKAL
mmetsp:Transcript_66457/g.214170  ORF Transcript_66457/g.214170 Transcript_66457/m.214170 type:complete len:213 (-) Transcript_66457:521-1159(-)